MRESSTSRPNKLTHCPRGGNLFREPVEKQKTEICLLLALGVRDYPESLAIQSQIVERRKRNEIPDCLLLLEYPHVITLGRSGRPEHLLATERELREREIQFFLTDRGGDITYHGPGQLIAYPVLDLKVYPRDIGHYLRKLESCIIATLNEFGIAAGRTPGATGVWVGDEKIAAIGVRTSQWVTSHGAALNVNSDLNYFKLIVPCGLHSKGVTSISRLLGRPVDLDKVKDYFCFHFERVFNRSLKRCPFSASPLSDRPISMGPCDRVEPTVNRSHSNRSFDQPNRRGSQSYGTNQ